MKILKLDSEKFCYYQIDDKVQTKKGHIFDLGDQLGCGGNAVVLECFGYNGDEYAIKFLLTLSSKNKSRFQQEIKVLQKIEHPNLIRYIDSGEITAKCYKKFAPVTEKKYHLLLLKKQKKI